jgi:hypothetical protein
MLGDFFRMAEKCSDATIPYGFRLPPNGIPLLIFRIADSKLHNVKTLVG